MTDSKGMAFAVPVWNWAKERPLMQVGSTGRVTLRTEKTRGNVSQVGGEVDLVLRDGDGSEAWRVRNVVAMEMQENGNWVLYNSRNSVAWESFGELRDTLLLGQKLYAGKMIVSSNDLFSMKMMPGGLLLSMKSKSPSPLYYWGVPINATAILPYLSVHALDLSANSPLNLTATFLSYACPKLSIAPYGYLSVGSLVADGGCMKYEWTNFMNTIDDVQYPSDFLRLADNGVPEGFTYLYNLNLGEHVLFSAQSDFSTCFLPNACGPYGICTASVYVMRSACHCPSTTEDPKLKGAFIAINNSDTTQGCARSQPLQCGAHVNTSFAVIRRTSMFSILLLFETNYKSNTYSLEECQARCLSDCSCAGFFYHTDTSFCLPFSDTVGLSNISYFEFGNPAFSVYVKVQSAIKPSDRGAVYLHGDKLHSHMLQPMLYVIIAVTAMVILGSLVFVLQKYRRNHACMGRNLDLDSGEEDLEEVLPDLPKRYSYRDLHRITRGFDKLLGTGGHGSVYEGVLADGQKVAVKKLDQVLSGQKQFRAEVATMGSTSHYNVARLCGFCSQRSNHLLVYEFMENGSLDQWLFYDRILSWGVRFDIALGTAHGLAYLHEGCPRPIIHFDVKPQNILLDRNFVPKISDFGVSKLVERESSLVMTGVRGTRGYLAPEWLSNSGVSKRCDVYSYGMVLLELVAGRRNRVRVPDNPDGCDLPTFASTMFQQGKMLEVVDRRLAENFDKEQVRMLLHVAFMCIQREPNARPSMATVCKILEGAVPLENEPPFVGAAFERPPSPEPECSFEAYSVLTEGR
ncbi:hypothetical protein KP509_28G051200 [Ceratopteris richardii]|nr:hypothetical protein KP509_28G051200 [Ceratopteris richardii]